MNVLMEAINETIGLYYADAQDLGVPWDRGWVFDEVESYEIIDHIDPGWSETLVDDIINNIGYDNYFVSHSQGDWGLSNPSEALKFGWEDFTNTVLHKTRFLFLSEPIDQFNESRPDYIPVSNILEIFSDLVQRHNLISTLEPNQYFYRVRAQNKGEAFNDFKQLSVPPKVIASSGRMNPSGIPYFYVAFDRDTAIYEVINKSENRYSIATLKSKKQLYILDLSSLPDFPSIFESDKYWERHELQFLYQFREEISKPINKDKSEHIEYIPTQIISEYFRHRFKFEDKNLNGVIYNSSKNKGGKNLTLFLSEHKDVEDYFSLISINSNQQIIQR